MSQELRHISWRDDGWLAQYGMISTINALQYFAGSPFAGEPGKLKLDGTGQQRALYVGTSIESHNYEDYGYFFIHGSNI
jgi:hypothetical protein